MALVDVQIVPVGTNLPSFSSFVSEACRAAARSGVSYRVTPMGTVLEGPLEQVLPVAQRMHEAALQAGAARVVTNLTIDDRTDKPMSMSAAVESVTTNLS